jgi:FkbM family methyltransferase
LPTGEIRFETLVPPRILLTFFSASFQATIIRPSVAAKPTLRTIGTKAVHEPAHDAMPIQPPSWLGRYQGPRGAVFFPRGDKYIGQILGAGRVFCPGAEAVFDQIVSTHDVAADVGANCGVFSVGLADRVGAAGRVLALEPQLNLAGLIHLSALVNDTPHLQPISVLMAEASGGIQAFPQPKLAGSANFGGVGSDVVGALRDLGVPLAPIPVLALDDFSLERLDFLKMDVEGYEGQVVSGALTTIETHRPVIWGEADRPDKTIPWLKSLLALGYRCSLHVHAYVEVGRIPELDDVFSFDLLALPSGRGDVTVDHQVYPVESVEDYLSAIRSWNQETGSGA